MLLSIEEPGATKAPHEKMPLAVGIDLGTTHSLVAVKRGATVISLPDETGACLLPSAVAYTPQGVVVGRAAQTLLTTNPEWVAVSTKRFMGKDNTSQHNQSTDSSAGVLRLSVAGKAVTAVEIAAQILSTLKQRAEAALEEPVTHAVITVPAYFDDAARQATKDAAALAGLTVLRLLNEPTAAALAYGLDEGLEGLYGIYDLGGGTFDFSLLRLERGVFQVLATAGDTQLGGDDIDARIVEWAYNNAQQLPDPLRLAQALVIARAAKERLSTEPVVSLALPDLPAVLLTATELDNLIAPLLSRTTTLVQAALRDAKVAPADLQGVVLVGGATRMPYVRRLVEAFFGKPPLTNLDPDTVVAQGAAVQAYGLTRGHDTLLLDVCPLSLGLETMGGLTEKIIDRNTPIPVMKQAEFTTAQDGQTALLLHVVQGERERAADCRSLARFTLRGIPPLLAGAARINVRFAIDADGLLTVSAFEQSTGQAQTIEVKPTYGLDEDTMRQMLLESFSKAAEDIQARLLIEARLEADHTLRAYHAAVAQDGALLTPEENQALLALADRLAGLIKLDDRAAIIAAREQLETAAKPFVERRLNKALRDLLAGQPLADAAKTVAKKAVSA